MTDHVSGLLVAAIRAVPKEDESPVPVEELCERAGFDRADAAVVGPVLLRLLGGFGVLRTSGGGLVKAASPIGSLFLSSYAEYLAAGAALLDNWSRPGATDPPYGEAEALNGPQFLYLSERRRLRADPTAPALRGAEVAQVVIARRGRGDGTRYLMLYDGAARQYQLPGGHRRPGDADMRDVAARELQEELPGFALDPARDQLVELGVVETTQVSRTYGVATAYSMTFFQLRSTRTELDAGPQARWLDAATLLAADPAGDPLLNVAGLRQLDRKLPGGIRGLAPGLLPRRPSWLVMTARTRPLEFWGFVVGVAGLVTSVVFFLLS